MSDLSPAPLFRTDHSWRARARFLLSALQVMCQVLGLPAVILGYGFEKAPLLTASAAFVPVVLVATCLTAVPILELRLSPARRTYVERHGTHLVLVAVTIVCALFVLALGGWSGVLVWLHLVVAAWVLLGILSLIRYLTIAGWSPALLFALTFVGLITLGTLLLMLPRSAASGTATDFHVALFTATSAGCVTGLTVVSTGSHWSPDGQAVILVMIQLGGLGLMICGTAFAMMVHRGLQIRETTLMSELLERDVLADLRQLMRVIILFTLGVELGGAFVLSGLWSDKPFWEQAFYSVFHSVSAFCNAGFSLHDDSMTRFAERWEILLGMPMLIVLGGLGFVVTYDIGVVLQARLGRTRVRRRALFFAHKEQVRFRLTTRIVLWTTLVLLVLGTVGIYLLERPWSDPNGSWRQDWSRAWFYSVSARTAGFNVSDVGELAAGTKLLVILLMGIGASPGSTGGGIKTVSIVICLFTLAAFAKGRNRVEIGNRTIPDRLVARALTIVALGFAFLFATTLCITAIENRPARFLDHLFEASSALATVGLSTGITAQLKQASQGVLIFAMFVGRVGPLTLIVSLAARIAHEPRYSYPEERVLLG